MERIAASLRDKIKSVEEAAALIQSGRDRKSVV